MPTRSRSQRAVLPSMSVKRKVTVPQGSSAKTFAPRLAQITQLQDTCKSGYGTTQDM
jgi:hypothetical protein